MYRERLKHQIHRKATNRMKQKNRFFLLKRIKETISIDRYVNKSIQSKYAPFLLGELRSTILIVFGSSHGVNRLIIFIFR